MLKVVKRKGGDVYMSLDAVVSIGVFVGVFVIVSALVAYFAIKSVTTRESESSDEQNPFTITD